jgi:shikimate kinase
MNIVLIGMRTSGKTTIGALLARRLHRKHIEIDDEIVQLAGQSIPDMVQAHGWEYFRDIESDIIQKVSTQHNNTVISTGGGVVTRPTNIDALKKHGFLILLVTNLEVITERIKHSPPRPALTTRGSIENEVIEIFNQREQLYEAAADMHVRTDTQGPESAVEEILQMVKEKNI